MIDVRFRAHPLTDVWQEEGLPDGLTVADIVERVAPSGRDWDVTLVRDGRASVVARDQFARVRPKDGTLVIVAPRIGISALFGAAVTWLAGATALTTAGATLVVAGAAIAISAGVILVTNRLFASSDPDSNRRANDRENPTLRGLQNTMPAKGSPVPMPFGRVNMAPVKCATGYTEMVGQKSYRVERMTFGMGPVVLEDLKIGTTPIGAFSGVRIQFRNVDEARTRAKIPALNNMSVSFLDDDDRMTIYSRDVFEDPDGARLNYNDRVVRSTAPNTISARVQFYFDGLVAITDENKKKSRSRKIVIAYRKSGTSGSWITATSKTYKGKTTATLWFGETINFPSADRWDISIMRTSKDDTDSQVRDDSYLAAIQSRAPGQLPSPSGVAEIVVRIKATDQISGSLDPINATVTRMLPVWDGSAWSDPVPTRHPAWIFAHLLRGPMRKRPVPDERLHLSAIKAWADAMPDWTYDHVVTGDMTLRDLVREVLAAGLVSLTMVDGKYSILTDRSREAPVQLFTPRTTSDFSITKRMRPEVHGLRIPFVSERNGWEEDELVVYAPGYDALTAAPDLIETITQPGFVVGKSDDITNVARFGRYHLGQLFNRLETVTIKTNLDHLVASRGAPVIFVSDVLRADYGNGRLRDVTRSSGVLVSVLLDGIDIEDGTSARIVVRGSSGAIQYFTATKAGDVWTMVPGSGVRQRPEGAFDPDDIAIGDLYTAGPVATEARKWLVADITPDFNESATITLEEATEAPLDALDAPLPEYDPKIISFYEVIDPRARIEYDERGMIAAIFWSALDPGETSTYRVILEDSEGDPVGTYEGADRVARFPVEGAFPVSLVARMFVRMPSGAWGPEHLFSFSTASQFEAPPAVTGFGSRVAGDAIHLTWDTGTSNIDYYTIRYNPATVGASWAASVPVVPKARGETVSVPAQNGTYLIKAVTVQGAVSPEAAVVVITSVTAVANAVERLTLAPSFDGTRSSGLTVIGGELVFVGDTDLLEIEDLVSVFDVLTYERENLTAIYDIDAADIVDLGYVDTVALSVEAQVLGYVSGFDLLGEPDLLLVPDFLGGAADQFDVRFQVSTTLDDPSGSPTWADWSDLVLGDLRARAFRFRVLLAVTNPQVIVKISTLEFVVDMADRVEKGADLLAPTGGYAVTFDPPFRVAPAIAVDGQGMTTGDVVEITGKSKAGFTVTFRNSGGAAVERDFDFIAVGYGREGS